MGSKLNPPSVCLDSMLFMYFLDKTDGVFHQLSVKTFKSLFSQKTKLITSTISVLETLSFPKLSGNQNDIDSYFLFFKTCPNLIVYPVDMETSLTAANLRRRYPPLKTPDSIQLATAIIHHADLFITNDDRLKHLNLSPLKIRAL